MYFIRKNKKLYNNIIDDKKNSLKEEGGRLICTGIKDISITSSSLIDNNTGKNIHPDYKDMSDDELKNYVNRFKLEEQYAKYTNQIKYIKSKNDKIKESLQIISAIASISVSLIMIYKGIKEIKYSKYII